MEDEYVDGVKRVAVEGVAEAEDAEVGSYEVAGRVAKFSVGGVGAFRDGAGEGRFGIR